MGVKGLWPLLEPAARPAQLDSLRGKRLAVDASIWIHQFVKALQDREGDPLRYAHLLGFLRRICKLLFYGIKPVFVFDGATPDIKRRTIVHRQQHRERLQDNAKRTAEKIVRAQLKLQALATTASSANRPEDDGQFAQALRDSSPQSKRKIHDPYDIGPTFDSRALLHQPHNDPRLVLKQELENFVQEHQDEIIDIDSEVFQSLPIELQHEVILDLKNKSRQTSWERVEEMARLAPTGQEFSQLQIKNLVNRNDLMQKYLKVSGMEARTTKFSPSRIASERNREYVLVKNNKDVGGWVMGTKRSHFLPNASQIQQGDDTSVVDLTKDERPKSPDLVLCTSPGVASNSLPVDTDEDDEFEEVTLVSNAPVSKPSQPDMGVTVITSTVDLEASTDDDDNDGEPLEFSILEEATSLSPFVPTDHHDGDQIKKPEAAAVTESKPLSSTPSTLLTSHSAFMDRAHGLSKSNEHHDIIPGTDVPDQTIPQRNSPRTSPVGDTPAAIMTEIRDRVDLPSAYSASSDVDDDKVDWYSLVQSSILQPVANSPPIENEQRRESSQTLEDEPPEPASEKIDTPQTGSPKAAHYASTPSPLKFIPQPEEADEPQASKFAAEVTLRGSSAIEQGLSTELTQLQRTRANQERLAGGIDQEIVEDVMTLLRLFGIPFIVAPSEAEAECAELVRLQLVDGIVTDDSDVFLFGGDRVYRHMFHQDKHVEYYRWLDLRKELAIDRDKLIQLAYLMGSDYTEGIAGVGLVTALEIVHEWPGYEGLQNFKEWWREVADPLVTLPGNSPSRQPTTIKQRLARLAPKLELPEVFPDPDVQSAYVHPVVSKDDTIFQWGYPDLDGLRDYLIPRLAWPQEKLDQLIVPILRKVYQRPPTQSEGSASSSASPHSTLLDFFSPGADTVSLGTGFGTPWLPQKFLGHKSTRMRYVIQSWKEQQSPTKPGTSRLGSTSHHNKGVRGSDSATDRPIPGTSQARTPLNYNSDYSTPSDSSDEEPSLTKSGKRPQQDSKAKLPSRPNKGRKVVNRW
ncbi:DNA repair protein rad2 [Dispira parvispora]|uniref:DNA repair protein rad2 n=1 Tax=Dispira parvispora TaxID=1520584 RepID=A0A9W8AUV3_9FUNG|nr:DNA repair protein rad2 [Dispira parvispora]